MFIRSPKELALLIVSRRKKLNLSQTAVAKLVGLKQQTVSEFENKPESTKLATLFKILSAVKLDASVLAKEEQLVTESQWNEEW